jgi:hypothetical protein
VLQECHDPPRWQTCLGAPLSSTPCVTASQRVFRLSRTLRSSAHQRRRTRATASGSGTCRDEFASATVLMGSTSLRVSTRDVSADRITSWHHHPCSADHIIDRRSEAIKKGLEEEHESSSCAPALPRCRCASEALSRAVAGCDSATGSSEYLRSIRDAAEECYTLTMT